MDQEKVFDHVEHHYLWKVLEVFRFNSGFRMIKVMSCDIKSLLRINGSLCASLR